MIMPGQTNDGQLAHNGSFFAILSLPSMSAPEVALKIQWGDFSHDNVSDMRFKVEAPLANLLRTFGWIAEDVYVPAANGFRARTISNVVTPPPDTEIFVVGERDSYWEAQGRGAVLHASTGPARDPNSVSMFRDMLPNEATVLDAGYVRAYARGIWKNGVYEPVRDERVASKAQYAWKEAQYALEEARQDKESAKYGVPAEREPK